MSLNVRVKSIEHLGCSSKHVLARIKESHVQTVIDENLNVVIDVLDVLETWCIGDSAGASGRSTFLLKGDDADEYSGRISHAGYGRGADADDRHSVGRGACLGE